MRPFPTRRSISALLLLLLPACRGSAGGDGADGAPDVYPQYTREIAFFGRMQGEPLAVALAFRTLAYDSIRLRSAQGLIARGRKWEAFARDAWQDVPTAEVWNVVPHGDLRLSAGAGGALDALWFREGGRRLRLDLGRPHTGWTHGRRRWYRVLSGTLDLGGERTAGVVVEMLSQRQVGPGSAPAPKEDVLVLTAADSLLALLVDGGGESSGWLRDGAGERSLGRVEIVPVARRTFEPARRDIPLRWRLSAPEVAMDGEVWALGYAAQAGVERGGRRAVEVRYTVSGWVRRGGVRTRVLGELRHTEG